MIIDVINKTIWFVVLVLLQALVFDKMTLLGVATPLAYIYLLLIWNKSGSRIGLLIMGFVLGLVIDTFENMPGVNASACVLLAFLQPIYLKLFTPRDLLDEPALNPSVKTLGWGGFFKYAFLCVLTHHIVVMNLLFFSFSDLTGLLLRIMGCTLMTLFVVIIFELIRNTSKR